MVESVVIQSAPAGADAPGSNPDAGTPPAGNEPVKLAGKFDSPADLERAYLELQSKLGQTKAPEATPPKPNEPPKDPLKVPDAATVDAAKTAVENAGLDFNSLSQKYAEKGELATEDYAKLEKAGIPKAMVDSFIAGQKAIADSRAAELRTTAFTEAGGEENYGKMVEWAAQNMDAGQKKAFNDLVESGDPAKVKIAVASLSASYAKAGAAEPNNITADRQGVEGSYASLAELMKDMGDSRYHNDEAFRARVEAKLARSNVL